jgi:hypothetical protein
MSELVLLGLVERAKAVLYAQAERLSEANRRLELEYLQRESSWERHPHTQGARARQVLIQSAMVQRFFPTPLQW